MHRRSLNATSGLADTALKLCTLLAKYWRTRTALVDQGYRGSLNGLAPQIGSAIPGASKA